MLLSTLLNIINHTNHSTYSPASGNIFLWSMLGELFTEISVVLYREFFLHGKNYLLSQTGNLSHSDSEGISEPTIPPFLSTNHQTKEKPLEWTLEHIYK